MTSWEEDGRPDYALQKGVGSSCSHTTTTTIMHTLRNLRPVLRTTVLSRSLPHTHLAPLAYIRSQPSQILRIANAFQQHRAVASHVSGRPASQTISQAALNVREEVGNSTTDWAKVIAGGNYGSDTVKTDRETFVSGSLS
jgi:hypothetical protein